MFTICSVRLFAAACLVPAFSILAELPEYDVSFEPDRGGELSLNQVEGKSVRYHFYEIDGHRFNLPAQGNSLDPVITTEQARDGGHAILFKAEPSKKDRDRIEFRLVDGRTDEQGPRFGQPFWYGVSIFIDPSSQPPRPGQWLHLHQLWQPSTIGTLARRVGWGIPMTISVKPGQEDFQLHIVCKSDGSRSQFDMGSLEAGRWHDLVFNVLLSHSKDDIDGYLRVWVDGESVLNETVEIGNYPRENTPEGFTAMDAMDVRFGVYRKAQPNTVMMLLDDLWLSAEPRDTSLEPGEPKGPTQHTDNDPSQRPKD